MKESSIDTAVVAALIAAAVALFGLLATHRLALARESSSTLRSAAATFRDAFKDTLLNLRNSEISTARVVQQFRAQHEAAIAAFQSYVPKNQRMQSEAAATHLSKVCDAYKSVGVIGLFSSGLGPQALENRRTVVMSIERLLTFAPLL